MIQRHPCDDGNGQRSLATCVNEIFSPDGDRNPNNGSQMENSGRWASASINSLLAFAHSIFWYGDIDASTDERSNERPDTGRVRWNIRVADELAAQRVFPLDVPSECGGYYAALLSRRHPEDCEAADRSGDDALARGADSYHHEFRCYDRDGKERWLFEDVYLLPQGSGRWRAVGVISDITPRKEAEQRLLTANDLLAKNHRELVNALAAVKGSHEELLQTQLQLIDAERLDSAGRLAAGVAHEVKNPLAVLLMGVDFLSNTLGKGDSRISAALDAMRQAVGRADVIVRGLVDFSAPRQLELQAQDLNAVLEKSTILVSHEFLASHVRVVKQFGENLPVLRLDTGKIEQVFVNVLTNAAHAMAGGGTLTIRTYATSAQAGAEQPQKDGACDGTRVIVEVDDTGPGVPPDKLGRIFEPFFTTKPRGKGTGLGLSVCRKIIALHSGTVDIKNLEGTGARVTIVLNA